MKIKIFTAHSGTVADDYLADLEKDVNAWLDSHPGITFVDLRVNSVCTGDTKVTVWLILCYKENQ